MSYMFEYSFAAKIASELIAIISSDCEKIQVVGSLRRNASVVKDVDIIAIPRFVVTLDDTLFGEPITINLLDRKLSACCENNFLQLVSNGPKFKRFIKPVDNLNIPVDVYIASELTWWTLLLIRTGSRDHNIELAMRANNLHMQLKADGSGLLTPGGSLIQVQSEEEIFRRLGLPYKFPEQRN